MNSKPIFSLINHRRFFISFSLTVLFLQALTLPLLAQGTSQEQDGSQENENTEVREIEELTEEVRSFIAKQPLTPQYDDLPYQGPDINPKKSYNKKSYLRSNIATYKDLLIKRVELAISYREQGDIDQFNGILLDVIARNNYNEEAAWAALLLGDFELLLYNLEEARKFYIYIVNVHYYSHFGLGGMYKLAITLDRMAHWSKAEELLNLILENTQEHEDNLIKQEVRDYLKTRYLEQARWHLEQGNDSLVREYFSKYKKLQ